MGKWKTQKARFPLSHRACRRVRKDDGRRGESTRRAATPPTFLRNSSSPTCNLSARFFCYPSARQRRTRAVSAATSSNSFFLVS